MRELTIFAKPSSSTAFDENYYQDNENVDFRRIKSLSRNSIAILVELSVRIDIGHRKQSIEWFFALSVL